MSQSIPIKPFRMERFAVEVRLRRGQGKHQPITKLETACCVMAIVPLLVSCAPAPMTLAPVGPGAFAPPAFARGMGALQVYTEPEEYYEDDMSYFPHTDYQLLTPDGKHLRRVWNHNTHEDETPAVVSLPPGRCVVRARAEFYGLVSVPVVVEPNKLTKVILQPGWSPGPNVSYSDLVQIPEGYFVGWRAGLAGTQ
jgi:hypothetical protein